MGPSALTTPISCAPAQTKPRPMRATGGALRLSAEPAPLRTALLQRAAMGLRAPYNGLRSGWRGRDIQGFAATGQHEVKQMSAMPAPAVIPGTACAAWRQRAGGKEPRSGSWNL